MINALLVEPDARRLAGRYRVVRTRTVETTPEWWQRVAERWLAWQENYPRLARRLAYVRVAALWVALPVLLIVYIAFPEIRDSFRIWLGAYLVLIVWFVMARTKSVSWGLYAGVFAVAMLWSFLVGRFSTWLGDGIAGGVNGAGAGVGIAGFTEEALKLVPLAVLALAAPGLVRRFAVVDWMLAGLASGLAFTVVEEMLRHIVLAERGPSFLELLVGRTDGVDPERFGWTLFYGRFVSDEAAYPGHHVATAMVTATIGLAIAAWRRAQRLTAAGRGGGPWRVAAVLAPLAAWWIAVTDHFGYNAHLRGDWIGAEGATAPWLIRATWDWAGHGHGRGWLFVAVVVVALLVDARRLARDPSGGEVSGAALGLAWSPVDRGTQWGSRLTAWTSRTGSDAAPVLRGATRWLAAALRAACVLVAYVLRDLEVLVAAHGKQPDESRVTALRRGQRTGRILRMSRARQYAVTVSPAAPAARWRVRMLALAALVAMFAAGWPLATWVADELGYSLTSEFWLAGVLDALAQWWGGLSFGEQLLVGAGVVALVMLSGGSLGLAFGVAGVTMYTLDHGRGAATFLRDPRRAVQDYITTRSPAGMVLDGAEVVLTFAPFNFRSAPAVRQAVRGPSRHAGNVPSVSGRAPSSAASTELAPGLNAADRAALSDYTGDGYRDMNNYLRNTSNYPPADEAVIQARADQLSGALAKLPPEPGVTYRGANLPDDVLARYQPGELVTEHAFTSTSRSQRVATGNFDGNALFAIDGQTGRDVASFSHFPDEAEILFDRGTDFVVTSRTWVPELDKWLITMMEVVS